MKKKFVKLALLSSLACTSHNVFAADPAADCSNLPNWNTLQSHLATVAPNKSLNGGFGLNMWATVVNRDGYVCAVAYTGADRNAQWPGSRIISAQKANTANAFSLPNLALSTANLYTAVQPGGSLYGLQFSNPVDTNAAYAGPAGNYGQANDPLVGTRVGGVNVFGGGLALYKADGTLVGAIGVSGDTSCADHNIAWRTRLALGLDHVPGGVSHDSARPDNIVFDIHTVPGLQTGVSASGWGHPTCVNTVTAGSLPGTH
ncbi:heme-binding protein [Methylomonas sp. AM2-LC]|uniref:GlcG/HbpS family heme-binding protein n=1 Tax=Methylomonas sp. AM2-LC TaxID=3153301 RepID=UPI003266DFE3